jgi:hypothetical protein
MPVVAHAGTATVRLMAAATAIVAVAVNGPGDAGAWHIPSAAVGSPPAEFAIAVPGVQDVTIVNGCL